MKGSPVFPLDLAARTLISIFTFSLARLPRLIESALISNNFILCKKNLLKFISLDTFILAAFSEEEVGGTSSLYSSVLGNVGPH